MNFAIVKNTYHRILTRPLVLLLVAAHVLLAILLYSIGSMNFDTLSHFSGRMSLWVGYTWILGAGLIGKDSSDGVLPLLFARPISRREYVLSRWAGLVLALTTFLLVDCIVLVLAQSGKPTSIQIGDFFLGALLVLWIVAMSAALVALFSSFMPSHGDVGLFLGIWLLTYILATSLAKGEAQTTIFKAVSMVLLPGLSVFDAPMDLKGNVTILTATLQAVVELYAAILIMRRKQVSYVAGS
jgi:ABC-type transport system involved in multi-copper enzyme maturation permease subunit